MNENMKLAFASIGKFFLFFYFFYFFLFFLFFLDISKVKFDPKGFQNKADVVKFENINQGAIKVI